MASLETDLVYGTTPVLIYDIITAVRRISYNTIPVSCLFSFKKTLFTSI